MIVGDSKGKMSQESLIPRAGIFVYLDRQMEGKKR